MQNCRSDAKENVVRPRSATKQIVAQQLSHAIELVEVAFKTLAEAKSACMSLVQTDSDATKHHDAANLDGDTYAECPC